MISTSRVLTPSGYQTLADLRTAAVSFDLIRDDAGVTEDVPYPITGWGNTTLITLETGQIIELSDNALVMLCTDITRNYMSYAVASAVEADDYVVMRFKGDLGKVMPGSTGTPKTNDKWFTTYVKVVNVADGGAKAVHGFGIPTNETNRHAIINGIVMKMKAPSEFTTGTGSGL